MMRYKSFSNGKPGQTPWVDALKIVESCSIVIGVRSNFRDDPRRRITCSIVSAGDEEAASTGRGGCPHVPFARSRHSSTSSADSNDEDAWISRRSGLTSSLSY